MATDMYTGLDNNGNALTSGNLYDFRPGSITSANVGGTTYNSSIGLDPGKYLSSYGTDLGITKSDFDKSSWNDKVDMSRGINPLDKVEPSGFFTEYKDAIEGGSLALNAGTALYSALGNRKIQNKQIDALDQNMRFAQAAKQNKENIGSAFA